MGVLYARETPQDNFTPVSTMGVGLASQSQAGLMSVPDKVKLDGIEDYIVEQGTNANGIYRKWNGGILECWGKLTGNGGVVTTDLPSTYKDTSYLIYYGSENGVGALPHAGAQFSTTQMKTYNTLSGQISTYYTIGTWK